MDETWQVEQPSVNWCRLIICFNMYNYMYKYNKIGGGNN